MKNANSIMVNTYTLMYKHKDNTKTIMNKYPEYTVHICTCKTTTAALGTCITYGIQWAAVKMCVASMMEPPHSWLPLMLSRTCHGSVEHEPASVPPTMRDLMKN